MLPNGFFKNPKYDFRNHITQKRKRCQWVHGKKRNFVENDYFGEKRLGNGNSGRLLAVKKYLSDRKSHGHLARG
jgi:hypothetical protein